VSGCTVRLVTLQPHVLERLSLILGEEALSRSLVEASLATELVWILRLVAVT